jgi:uncharacterized coiled-coil DUF342 family protein
MKEMSAELEAMDEEAEYMEKVIVELAAERAELKKQVRSSDEKLVHFLKSVVEICGLQTGM